MARLWLHSWATLGPPPTPAESPCSPRAVRRILARARQLVDAQKEDGFTALHLAALNNHWEVAQVLIREVWTGAWAGPGAGESGPFRSWAEPVPPPPQGRCDVNVRNRKLQSPLHLAVQQAHVGLVPLLVDSGCSVNAEDEEGDTALHVALQRHQLLPMAADGAGGDPGPLQLLSRVRKCDSGCQRGGHLAEGSRTGLTSAHLHLWGWQAFSGWGGSGHGGLQEASSVTSATTLWPVFLEERAGPDGYRVWRVWGWCQNSAPPPPRLRQGAGAQVLAARLPPQPPLTSVCPATQLQASGLPGNAELTAGAAVACFLALEGADLSYANHRGRSPLDLATEGRLLKALQCCAQRFR